MATKLLLQALPDITGVPKIAGSCEHTLTWSDSCTKLVSPTAIHDVRVSPAGIIQCQHGQRLASWSSINYYFAPNHRWSPSIIQGPQKWVPWSNSLRIAFEPLRSPPSYSLLAVLCKTFAIVWYRKRIRVSSHRIREAGGEWNRSENKLAIFCKTVSAILIQFH
jgi:hypothetical protein